MDAGTSFGLVVLQTELERFKFLVRSFLRARIAKVGFYFLYKTYFYTYAHFKPRRKKQNRSTRIHHTTSRNTPPPHHHHHHQQTPS